MKKHIFLASLLAMGCSINSCDDLMEPAPENTSSFEAYYGATASAHGVLLLSYAKLSLPQMPESDIATDDAVTNDLNDNWLKIATGSWTSDNNPVGRWNDYYYAIQNVNVFIENVDKVTWYNEPEWQALQVDHFLGEAYGLRAILHAQLLEAHAGPVGGQLMGILIHKASEIATTDFNQARTTFEESYKEILKDFDEAILRLPDFYLSEWTEEQIPQRLKDMGATVGAVNRVNGAKFCTGKLDARICKAYRARLALMAASPAYGVETWANAAAYAKEVVDLMGGVATIDDKSIDWFSDAAYVKTLTKEVVPSFAIWWAGVDDGKQKQEANNYPPSLYGSGRINPTQNLVDAFPMANGYPISESASGYNANDPYADRDPRLTKYILVNGDEQLLKTKIITAAYGTDKNAIDAEPSKSTRTGYYLKKLLCPTANPSSSKKKEEPHARIRFRALEMFLSYAEAINEAEGPAAGSPSAYDVIKRIREVSGITGGDAYLESIKGDKDKMRDLIRNERRICLCFENKRFWDLRRWKAVINEPVKGMRITGSEDAPVYNVFTVENREYKDYMYYGPIPTEDVNKYSNLQQNDGWK